MCVQRESQGDRNVYAWALRWAALWCWEAGKSGFSQYFCEISSRELISTNWNLSTFCSYNAMPAVGTHTLIKQKLSGSSRTARNCARAKSQRTAKSQRVQPQPLTTRSYKNSRRQCWVCRLTDWQITCHAKLVGVVLSRHKLISHTSYIWLNFRNNMQLKTKCHDVNELGNSLSVSWVAAFS